MSDRDNTRSHEEWNRAGVLEARAEMLRLLPSVTMVDDAGLRASQRALAVKHSGQWHYPKLQFDVEAEPYPEMQQLLEALGSAASGWDVVSWLIEPNLHLAGRAPQEVWAVGDRAAVVDAARKAHWFEPG
jgi:hypothetical protein